MRFVLVMAVLALSLLFGCSGTQTGTSQPIQTYACPNGAVVTDVSQCSQNTFPQQAVISQPTGNSNVGCWETNQAQEISIEFDANGNGVMVNRATPSSTPNIIRGPWDNYRNIITFYGETFRGSYIYDPITDTLTWGSVIYKRVNC